MNDNDRALLKTLLGSNTVRYYPSLAKLVGGATTALMLSQLLYWINNDNMRRKIEDRDGWFYIKCEDMEEQTGLTKNEQRTAREKLVSLGILELSYKGSSPRVTHYRVDLDAISLLIQSSEKPIIEKTEHQSLEKPPTNDAESVPSMVGKTDDFNTDTTPEINQRVSSEVSPGGEETPVLPPEKVAEA